MEVFNGTLADIKKVYPKELDEWGYNIVVVNKMGCNSYDSDCNTYPNREPYLCQTRSQADEYCNMIIDGLDAYETSIKNSGGEND